MLYSDDVPDSVSINEAVEMAKVYGGEDSSKFVNGVLGSFYSEFCQSKTR
jgi:N utilization substance protein B